MKGKYEANQEEEQEQIKDAWKKEGSYSLKDGNRNSELTCHIKPIMHPRRQVVSIHPSSHAEIPPLSHSIHGARLKCLCPIE